MAIKYYFFDSQEGPDGQQDRVYSADDFAEYLSEIVGSGVFPNPSDNLKVSAGTGMNVNVNIGSAWIDGHKMVNDSVFTLPIQAADVTLDRIDRVVMRLDRNNRCMDIVVKTGTPSSNPVAPTVSKAQNLKEFSLARVQVDRNTTQISNSRIYDTRLDSTVCGMVQGLIDQVDTSKLYTQWETAYEEFYTESTEAFDTWFEGIQGTVAGANMVQVMNSTYTASEDGETNIPINIGTYSRGVDVLNVYINGLRLLRTEDYSINTTGSAITLTKGIDAGTTVAFEVLKSVSGDDQTAVSEQVQSLQTTVEDIQYGFAHPNTLYSGSFAPTQLSSIRQMTVSNMSNYDIIIVRVEIGTVGKEDKIFYKNASSESVLTQSMSAYLNSTYGGFATIQINRTTNQVGIRAEAVRGWEVGDIKIVKVYGVKVN